ncbi:hypothetical protein BHJ80_01320 [Escherichia coli]|nr:hypothetical protein BHJ80_01320 [Escherichia coli]
MFRTEMLYMDRTSAPGESELYNIFCAVLGLRKRFPALLCALWTLAATNPLII